MGFYSWECCETGVSIPFNYLEDIVLVLPNDEVIRGTYNGYGVIGNDDILQRVSEARGTTKPGESVFDDGRFVEDHETKVRYQFGKDFEFYSDPIIVDGQKLYEGMDVNKLRELKYVSDVPTLYDKTLLYVKLLVHYAYKGQKYADLKMSENCDCQGFFYDEDYTNFPEDYHNKEI